MTFYLKYRPKNIDELDSVEVASSLKKIVVSGNIPHAFLFSGPKGTGKTSAARILAKVINCESASPKLRGPSLVNPCDECTQCVSITKGSNLDVVELDAASHRGIDDIRVLKDTVKLSPASAKKKIYIIDEAHMLTVEASNALLKTLEEPPDHVVFILATTNPEKLIDTIRSRTTTISFNKAKTEEIVSSLKRVVVGEGIKVEDSVLDIVANAAGGAFRDAIKILEQLVTEEVVLTKEAVEEFLFNKKAYDLESFVSLLVKKDTNTALKMIEKFETGGVSVQTFLTSLLIDLRKALLTKVGIGESSNVNLNKNELIDLIELMTIAHGGIPDSPIESLPLEIAVIKWCERSGEVKEIIVEENKDKEVKENTFKEDKSQTIAEPTFQAQTPVVNMTDKINDEAWRSILALIKPINTSIEALLRAARPINYDGSILTLGVYYKFHKERLEDSRHRRVLEDVVTQVLGAPSRIVCTLTEPVPKKVVEEAKVETVLTEGKDTDIIKAAEEIFGN